mgnify:CR=1 FL=1
MDKEFHEITEADKFVSATADNWLLSVNNLGTEKIAAISFIKYVPKHTVSDDLQTLGPVKNTMEVLGTFTLSEAQAREMIGVLSRMLDEYVIPKG